MISGSLMSSEELLEILSILSIHIYPHFEDKVMRQKLCRMINYLLTYFVGSKRRELNVEDKEEIHFTPQIVLSIIYVS